MYSRCQSEILRRNKKNVFESGWAAGRGERLMKIPIFVNDRFFSLKACQNLVIYKVI